MPFGRDAECAAVEGLIAAAGSSRSGALVVLGEPGVGKSALLGHAIERATGMRVLRASGIDAESELAFAALHQLVRPILDRCARLAEPQAAALAGALGLSRASVEDRFLILRPRAGRGGGARKTYRDRAGGARRVRALRARDGATMGARARGPLPRPALCR